MFHKGELYLPTVQINKSLLLCIASIHLFMQQTYTEYFQVYTYQAWVKLVLFNVITTSHMSELRCFTHIKYTEDFEYLILERNLKYLVSDFPTGYM